jgi:phage terminase Nu1 subunit (DNA packaging protein)
MQDTMPVLIDRKTAAKISGMSISWLRHMDAIGAGAPKLRLGQGPGRIRYDLEQYMDWLKGHQDPARRDDGGTASSPV